MQSGGATTWPGSHHRPGSGENDLNWIGRSFVGAVWFLNNVRIRTVGVFISGLMLLMLGAGIATSVSSAVKVNEISRFWRAFDHGAATKRTLVNELRENLGFGGFMHHVKSFALGQKDADHLGQAREVLLRVRGLIGAYRQAGTSAEEDQALEAVMAMVGAYEEALELLQAMKEADMLSSGLDSTLRVDDTAAIKGLQFLNQMLRQEYDRASHRVDNAFGDMRGLIYGALIVNTVLLLVLSVFFYWFTRRRIVRTLHQLDGAMAELAKGNNGIEVPLLEKRDELGDMARAVEVFKANAIQNERLNAEKQADERRRAQRAARLEQLTIDFGNGVEEVLGALAASSSQMHVTAQSMAATAEQTTRQAARAMAAAEHGAVNIQTVAAATTELAGSIAEIGRQVDLSAKVAENAVLQAEQVNERVRSLAEVSTKIGEVTDVITKIAEQTNLLALNASIEATRAGEAGKGFIVVANAVKNLARQTGAATEDIKRQVEEICEATHETVQAIQGIGSTIGEINSYSTAIAASVEEQSAATDEIARNAMEAAGLSKEVHANIAGVTQAADDTGKFARSVLDAATGLSRQSDRLGDDVHGFIRNVRAL